MPGSRTVLAGGVAGCAEGEGEAAADEVREGAAVGDGAPDDGEDDRAAAGVPGVPRLAAAEPDPPRCAEVLAGPHAAAASAIAATGTIQIADFDTYRMTTSPRQPAHRARPTADPIHPGTSSIRQAGRYREVAVAGYRSAATAVGSGGLVAPYAWPWNLTPDTLASKVPDEVCGRLVNQMST